MERVWIPALRRLMSEKGWSQTDLAKASGVRPNTISDLLAGADCRIDTLTALAKGLGAPLWTLFVDAREHAIFSEHVKEADVQAEANARDQAIVEAVLAKLVPTISTLVKETTGQSVASPANELPSTKVLGAVPQRKRKLGR